MADLDEYVKTAMLLASRTEGLGRGLFARTIRGEGGSHPGGLLIWPDSRTPLSLATVHGMVEEARMLSRARSCTPDATQLNGHAVD